jgi:hypothetical protein
MRCWPAFAGPGATHRTRKPRGRCRGAAPGGGHRSGHPAGSARSGRAEWVALHVEEGFLVRIAGSKIDQEGEGQTVAIARVPQLALQSRPGRVGLARGGGDSPGLPVAAPPPRRPPRREALERAQRVTGLIRALPEILISAPARRSPLTFPPQSCRLRTSSATVMRWSVGSDS